ncbi:BlaI/MecI/CopY family transcriptional regulator [Synechocystis sp. LKSZ1]|uniref:BlaI/MecI/CopY family transcriptional regulator n=1 Tax=Synechocystis sp. LKSZ1 TaxID=3144951 RepID=UPI00336BCD5A
MAWSPPYRPKQMSLGPLEQEILEILWQLGKATVKDIHENILANPDRELAYSSVTTVLNRLTNKGWLLCQRDGKAFSWVPRVSAEQARAIQSYEQLQQFLAVSNPEVVTAFADSLDTASLDQLEAIAARLKSLRRQRGEGA